MSVCLAVYRSQLGMSLEDSLAWQTPLPDAMAELQSCVTLAAWHVTGRLTCQMPLLYTQVQYPKAVLHADILLRIRIF